MKHVRRADEHHVREVVLDVEIVVEERAVLLGVEHFEQRRRRVAAEVHRHFVDLIEHDDGVFRAGLLHHLDELSGKGADIRAAMSADLSFIAHAAQRHADKLAAGRLSDRHTERSLADAWRSDEAQDGAFWVLYQLADRQKFQNAILYLFQSVVVGIQDLFRTLDIADLFRALLPRHSQQPV